MALRDCEFGRLLQRLRSSGEFGHRRRIPSRDRVPNIVPIRVWVCGPQDFSNSCGPPISQPQVQCHQQPIPNQRSSDASSRLVQGRLSERYPVAGIRLTTTSSVGSCLWARPVLESTISPFDWEGRRIGRRPFADWGYFPLVTNFVGLSLAFMAQSSQQTVISLPATFTLMPPPLISQSHTGHFFVVMGPPTNGRNC